jgi:hypothetical protein
MSKLRILTIHELWWPRGRGGVLTIHLKTRMVAKCDLEVRVVAENCDERC